MSQLDSPQPATRPAEPKPSSPVRLIVLLAILGIVLAGFLVDTFMMYDQVKAASKRLEAAANEVAGQSFDKSKPAWLSHEEVAKAIGFQPTNSNVEDGRLVEHYRWWGSIPLQRRFIMVMYDDVEGQRYSGYEISNRNIFGQDEDDLAKEVEPPPEQPQPEGGEAPPQGSMPMPMPGNPAGSDGKTDDSATDKGDSAKPAPPTVPEKSDDGSEI